MSKTGENINKRKDGRWEARYVKGKNENGKTIFGYVYGKTYDEAMQKKILAMQNMVYTQEDKKLLFAEALDAFMDKKKNSVKASTYSHYCDVIEKHIRPVLGKLPIQSITGQTIERFADQKLKNGRIDGNGGLAAKNVRDMLSIIKMALDIAQSNNIIQNKVSFSRPRLNHRKIEILSSDEQAIILAQSTSYDPRKFGYYLCLQTGLRIGEICALKWSDIDFENEVINVQRTVLRISDTADNIIKGRTKLIFDSPKTRSSERIIPIPHSLAEQLSRLRGSAEEDLFVLTGSKHCLEPRTYSYSYKHFLKENNIHDYSFHALRHTFATRCIEKGFDAKSLSEILGHSNVKITLERYVHPSLALKREHMQKLTENF